jgi:hypothetical protein
MAATTISIPWQRAASNIRKGNLPFPAIKPYLLNDATFRRFDEIHNDLNFGRLKLRLNRLDSLRGVELGLKEQTESCLNVVDLI